MTRLRLPNNPWFINNPLIYAPNHEMNLLLPWTLRQLLLSSAESSMGFMKGALSSTPQDRLHNPARYAEKLAAA